MKPLVVYPIKPSLRSASSFDSLDKNFRSKRGRIRPYGYCFDAAPFEYSNEHIGAVSVGVLSQKPNNPLQFGPYHVFRSPINRDAKAVYHEGIAISCTTNPTGKLDSVPVTHIHFSGIRVLGGHAPLTDSQRLTDGIRYAIARQRLQSAAQ